MIPEYRDTYTEEGIYGDFTYGSPSVSRSFIHATFVTQGGAFEISNTAKVLCIGSGNGYEIAKFRLEGFKCFGIDLYVPDVKVVKDRSVRGDASNMPFRDDEFDLVFCTETFEHIPEEICFKILAEVKRVGLNFYFTVSTKDDKPYDTHINIHDAWWWMDKFNECGLKITHAEAMPVIPLVYGGNRIVKLRYIEGVLIYGLCNT